MMCWGKFCQIFFLIYSEITKNHLRQVIVYWLQRKLQIFNGDSRLSSRLVFAKATVLDVEVEVMLFLQFLKDGPVGFLIKMVTTIENFKAHTLVF